MEEEADWQTEEGMKRRFEQRDFWTTQKKRGFLRYFEISLDLPRNQYHLRLKVYRDSLHGGAWDPGWRVVPNILKQKTDKVSTDNLSFMVSS